MCVTQRLKSASDATIKLQVHVFMVSAVQVMKTAIDRPHTEPHRSWFYTIMSAAGQVTGRPGQTTCFARNQVVTAMPMYYLTQVFCRVLKILRSIEQMASITIIMSGINWCGCRKQSTR